MTTVVVSRLIVESLLLFIETVESLGKLQLRNVRDKINESIRTIGIHISQQKYKIFLIIKYLCVMKKIAIFASGNGSNAEAIVKYFDGREDIKVEIVLSNRSNAAIHERMGKLGIPSVTFQKEQWNESTTIVELLKEKSIDLIVLAGFLAIIQPAIIKEYTGRIINIHPSLLPRHGGAGMWGMHVHKAVIDAQETESGITIHHVNEAVDGGAIISQHRCEVMASDTPEVLAERVHELEYYHYPRVIESILLQS